MGLLRFPLVFALAAALASPVAAAQRVQLREVAVDGAPVEWEAYVAETGSTKAAAILADWNSWKGRFKLLVPPSERGNVGLAEKEAVAA